MNSYRFERDVTILDFLDKTVKNYPNKLAFSDSKRSVSFLEFQTEAKKIATGLLNNDIRRKPVIVFTQKSIDALSAFLGIAYSGNFYVPIDVDMPVTRINKVLNKLDASLAIVEHEYYNLFLNTDFRGKIVELEGLKDCMIEEKKLSEIRSSIIDSDLLYVLFTSGSTGTPKGVSISHNSVIDYIQCVIDEFHICSTDTLGNQAPFYFDNSILDIYSVIKTGATLYLIPKELFGQPVKLLEYLKEKKITTIFWVPSALCMVSKLKAFRNVDVANTLKKVLFCGEVMPNKQLNIWRKHLPDASFYNLYGPTEITDACTFYHVNREFSDHEPLPIGKPFRNTEILVLNEHGQLVCGSEAGELCVRGSSLSKGYYNDVEKTEAVFIQNPFNTAYVEKIYRTGDLVYYNEYHELVFLCRKDFQIKHMGHRIELGEIEMAALSIDGIETCCCIYDTCKNRIVLFTENEITKPQIIEGIRSLIPEYMFPSKVIYIKSMPLNMNGKIDRKKLEDLLRKGEN